MSKKDVFANNLPQKGVLFLGGHQNMTKKLRQIFPKWIYISDDHLMRHSIGKQSTIFFWTSHSSHKIMRYVYSKLPQNTTILYVTATNLPLLIAEMQQIYCLQTSQ